MSVVEGKTQGLEMASVLVVDDDPWVHRLLSDKLGSAQYAVHAATTASEALAVASREPIDIILLDVGLPDDSGLDTLKKLRSEVASCGVVMISGEESAEDIVEALRLGALDYLVKPLDPAKVLATVTLAARASRLERENRRLVRKLHELAGSGEMLGCSPALRRLAGVVRRAAECDATVLIEGKPGSGKTMAAELIHRGGRRSNAVLVTLLGATATLESLEAALLQAHRGSLLVEDVDLLPPPAQQRLVRYLKERPSKPGGGDAGPDARILATTSARLPELVARGKVREDLFYRLNVLPIVIPSLQERRDDIPLLAAHFAKRAAEAAGTPVKGFTPSAMILLESHPWPGNIAQLQGAIARALAVAGGGPIDAAHLLGPATGIQPEPQAKAPVAAQPAADDDEENVREEDVLPLDTEEKRLLARALRATKGNVRRAAQLLRIGRATLYRKIQIYKLKLQ